MSRPEVIVRHDAEVDAVGYFERIYETNPEAACRFLSAIDQTVESLGRFPLMGRKRRFRPKELRGVRSWRVDGFENYLIFYKVTGSRVEILRIKHGAMKFPNALRRRS